MTGDGKVYIVGAGPGDYKLMTLKAVECIGKADVIVYDRLLGRKVLSFAREDAEFVSVGKMPGGHAVPQAEIDEILVRKALAGKTVARVKGGDPFLFGRGAEEAEALSARGIAFEIVPGVTAALAVPAYAGIPVTHRDYCSSLHIITGHEQPGQGGRLDYATLAKLEGTLVFLMGVGKLPEIAGGLLGHGKDRSTPAAVIEKGTTGEQRVVTGILADISGKSAAQGIRPPAVIVLGEVVNLRDKLAWFPRGELAGKRVMVTRAREQAGPLVEKLEALGAEVLAFPMIKCAEPLDFKAFDEALANLKNVQWLVFTSVNAVRVFFQRMRRRRIDLRILAGVKICVIGEATGRELDQYGFTADYRPDAYTTQKLLEGLGNRVAPGEKVLLARADLAGRELAAGLAGKQIDLVDVVVYRTLPERARRAEILAMLADGLVDIITFTSSSTVRNFVAVIGRANLARLAKTKVICLGPVTARTATEAGLTVAATADVYTIDGLVTKLVATAEDG